MKTLLWFNLCLISSILVLSGCQRESTDDHQESKKEVITPSVKVPETASVKKPDPAEKVPDPAEEIPDEPLIKLITKSVKADYSVPACKGEECPSISIKRLETNDAWVTQFLDQQINLLSNIQLDESTPDTITLQQNIDQFLAVAKQDTTARGIAVPYIMQIDADYLGEKSIGEKGDLALFAIHAAYYTGGAHGSALKNYYTLNRKTQRQVKLDDIVMIGQRSKLYDLAYQQFTQWLKLENPQIDIQQYESMWPFALTDNFRFNKTGLTFQYQQYEIAPYTSGLPAFTVPYTQLNGIINAEYLD